MGDHTAPAVAFSERTLHKNSSGCLSPVAHKTYTKQLLPNCLCKGRSFLLMVRYFFLRLVFVAYGKLAWSFLLPVEIRFGLFCLRWKVVWPFLLTFPPVRKLDLVFLLAV